MSHSDVTTRRLFAKQSLLVAGAAGLAGSTARAAGDASPLAVGAPAAAVKPAAGATPPLPRAQVVDDDLGFVFVKEGESMPIREVPGGPALMTVDFTRGRSAVDTEDRSKIVVYPFPIFWATPAPTSLPGLPSTVWSVRQRHGKIYVTMKFGRWSEAFREACKQHWLDSNREFLAAEREVRGVPGLEVIIKRPPVIELFVAVQESTTGLTLAHAQQNVLRGPDVVELSFAFEPAAYEAFLRAHADDDVLYQPIWRARTRDFKLGVRRVDARLNIALQVANQLSSEQRDEGAPIDQITADGIARALSGEIQETIAVDDAEVLPMLESGASLVQLGILQPADWMSWDDFRKAHGVNAQRLIEEHLAPSEEVHANDTVSTTGKSTTEGDEHTERDGGGWGVSLPGFGLSDTDEDVKRRLKFVTDTTGVELREGSTRSVYLPHRVKAYQYSRGAETRQISETKVVAIGGQVGNHYLKDTPVPQRVTADLVARSLGETTSQSSYLADLLVEKRRKLEALDAELSRLEQARTAMKAHSDAIHDHHRKHVEAHAAAERGVYDSAASEGMRAWICHAKNIWKWDCPDRNELAYRTNERDAHLAKAKPFLDEAVRRHAEVEKTVPLQAAEDAAETSR